MPKLEKNFLQETVTKNQILSFTIDGCDDRPYLRKLENTWLDHEEFRKEYVKQHKDEIFKLRFNAHLPDKYKALCPGKKFPTYLACASKESAQKYVEIDPYLRYENSSNEDLVLLYNFIKMIIEAHSKIVIKNFSSTLTHLLLDILFEINPSPKMIYIYSKDADFTNLFNEWKNKFKSTNTLFIYAKDLKELPSYEEKLLSLKTRQQTLLTMLKDIFSQRAIYSHSNECQTQDVISFITTQNANS